MNKLPKIFVETEDSKGIGFTFLHDTKAMHNHIHPECLGFFWGFLGSNISPNDENVHSSDDARLSIRHLRKRLPSIDEGRKIVKCYDGKFRRCDIVSFRFVIDEKKYNELFVVDKSLCIAGILGRNIKHKILKP